jgi:hypothetical protein
MVGISPPASSPKLGLFCTFISLWVGRPRPTSSEGALFRTHVESTITLFPPGTCPSYRRCRIGFVSHVQSPVPTARATPIGFVSRSGASRRCCTMDPRTPEAVGPAPIRDPQSAVRNRKIGFVLHGHRILQNSRNRLSQRQLASFCLIRKLGLFRTIASRRSVPGPAARVHFWTLRRKLGSFCTIDLRRPEAVGRRAGVPAQACLQSAIRSPQSRDRLCDSIVSP